MPISEVFNEDCMIGMKRYPDKFFDLAIVDPPYGIGNLNGKEAKDGCTHGKHRKRYTKKGWDNATPSKEYFDELFRVSVNQVIWGANYFASYLPASMGWIFWDKGQDLDMSDGELAFSSFNKALRRYELNRCFIGAQGGLIHPTQKPVKLYNLILKNYAKTGDRILDTHLGSQSHRIAAYKLGFDFWGWEIDEEYYDEGNERFKKAIAEPLFDVIRKAPEQTDLFQPT